MIFNRDTMNCLYSLLGLPAGSSVPQTLFLFMKDVTLVFISKSFHEEQTFELQVPACYANSLCRF